RDPLLHQPDADPLAAEIGFDCKRPEQKRRRTADGNRPEAHRTEQQARTLSRSDEGKTRVVLDALAQVVSRLGKAARPETERHHRLDSRGVAFALGSDFPHSSLPWSHAVARNRDLL